MDLGSALAQIEPPVLRVPRRWPIVGNLFGFLGTREYRGRVLGHLEFTKYEEDVVRAGTQGNGLSEAERFDLLAPFLEAAGLPREVAGRLPRGLLTEVVFDFLDCQFQANTGRSLKPKKSTPSTRGSRSRRKDSDAPTSDARRAVTA